MELLIGKTINKVLKQCNLINGNQHRLMEERSYQINVLFLKDYKFGG